MVVDCLGVGGHSMVNCGGGGPRGGQSVRVDPLGVAADAGSCVGDEMVHLGELGTVWRCAEASLGPTARWGLEGEVCEEVM